MNVVKNILGYGDYVPPNRRRLMICPNCDGDGLDENMKTCKRCDGTGSIPKRN